MSETKPTKPGEVEVTPEMRQKVGEVWEIAESEFCTHAQRLVDKGEMTEVEILATLQQQMKIDFEDVWREWMRENT